MPPHFDWTSQPRLRARTLPRIFGLVLLGIAAILPAVLGAQDSRSSRGPGSWEAHGNSSTAEPEQSAAECCTGPDITNFGKFIDFNIVPNRVEIGTQYRPNGVLFGRGASGEAQRTLVEFDYGLASGCRKVLTGDPAFTGWEFFIFVDSLSNRWAAVQRVGARIGHAKRPHSCFLAAYDSQGNLLEAKFNSQTGYQFLSIERPAVDINMVLVGDCLNTGRNCNPDPGGSALNCLSFSLPVSSGTSLPASISIPQPPIILATPSISSLSLAALGLALAVGGFWGLRRRQALPINS